MVAYKHNRLYTFLLQTSIVLTISPNDVNEGNTTVMECVVEKDPPSPAGTFVWTMKGDVTRNGLRIDIETTYEPQPPTSISRLKLTDSSWTDTGSSFSLPSTYLFSVMFTNRTT